MAANPGLTETLLNNGAVVEARTAQGFRPLHFACAARSLHSVEACLHAGASVMRCKTSQSLLTPVHLAAQVGNPEMLKQLLKRGTEELIMGRPYTKAEIVNEKDSGGRTALHYAAASGHIDATVVLINEGGELDCKDTDGWTSKQVSAPPSARAQKDLAAVARRDLSLFLPRSERIKKW
jgi:ankyrin repeat protein